ncbi:Golgi-associated kinase 1B [Scophthalmus maximus]|uniref:Golgi associated kinase 1B n=1 Tax=Scophthalmus maximus TaxID=52904 RepID=A0A8D3AB92_SCOMX|nr:Golgi-associated kinase 1B [Scophthalmus maximus]
MGKSRSRWPRVFPLSRLTSGFWRRPLSKRSLIVATACVVYLLFVLSYVGYSQQHRDRRTDGDKYRRARGLADGASLDSADPQTGTSLAVPTRSNVVYITLKFKRLKPANIRGTIRPKLRRKLRKSKSAGSAFTQDKLGTLERDAGQTERSLAPEAPWRETRDVDYKSLDAAQKSRRDEGAESNISSIRIYSQRAPQWFSARDVSAMRFLADAKVLRIREVPRGDSAPLLLFEGDTGPSPSPPADRRGHAERSDVCAGRCGVISSPVDTAEVFAFHLDRVLGLNRTSPAVSRTFRFLHDGRPCPVVSWDASLYPGGLAAGRAAVRLTWGGYQRSLRQRCWHRNIRPKPDSGCSTIHHYEWSKLALFDFLLQIHNRLDRSCCGFRPRREDVCADLGHRADCGDPDRIQLANIIHRGHDPRHLVFANNKGFFDRNEDNLDFRLLEGITELPEQAVSVLRSRRLRERLLQSLFLDQTYWESQGGRPGIDKLIDVVERRARALLTYINAHGIAVAAMNA